ncbi:histidine phosphatase family protein [uncultured Litoreibacter sp.]|uniref:histidine phosphatase family protein n=1 Tax=uncultured Litoreibacter sp. TaxID=1392394 RepID=UPI00260F53A4|nr:histidine phosphatase family protein [uncultured Litoreibacter sp.]
MRDFPELLILRHGETEWNREGRMQGALDSALTDRGREHAAQQAGILSQFDLTEWDQFSSPQGRAWATAQIALPDGAAQARKEPKLVEIGVGAWSGKLRADLHLDLPAGVSLEDGPDGPIGLYQHAPGGEGFMALRARVTSFLADLSGPSVIVTHGITSRMLRAVILNVPDEALGDLPGGQGVVYHLKDGVQKRLE